MKKIFGFFFLLFISFSVRAQDNVYAARKGIIFFPGHLEAFATISNGTLRYELYNHWYSRAYAELRQISIPINEIDNFNKTNTEIQIRILKNKIEIKDKKYHLNKKLKHRELCSSAMHMRKVSFAYKISKENDLGIFALFQYEDLDLPENEFQSKVLENLKSIKK